MVFRISGTDQKKYMKGYFLHTQHGKQKKLLEQQNKHRSEE